MRRFFVAALLAAMAVAKVATAAPNCSLSVDDQAGTINSDLRRVAGEIASKGYKVRLGSGYTDTEYVRACGEEGRYIYFIWNGKLQGSGYHSNVTSSEDFKEILSLVKAGDTVGALNYVNNAVPNMRTGGGSSTTTTHHREQVITTTPRSHGGFGVFGWILGILVIIGIVSFIRWIFFGPRTVVVNNGGYGGAGYNRGGGGYYPSTFGVGGMTYPGAWYNGGWGYWNGANFIAMEMAIAGGAILGAGIAAEMAMSPAYGWQPGWGEGGTTVIDETDTTTTYNSGDTGGGFADTGGSFDDGGDTGGSFDSGDTGGGFGGGDDGGSFGNDDNNN